MKNPKTYYPLIAATVIIAGGLIPTSFGGEKPSAQKIAVVSQDQNDPVVKLLNAEVINPLTKLSSMHSRFSREGPTHSTSYHLVETSNKAPRTFKVVQKMTPLRGKVREPKSSDYLNLRYLNDSEQIQVDLKGQWVSLSEHPILKRLPKPEQKPVSTITP